MKMPWEGAIESITSLISEAIPDPDKQAEIGLKIRELKVEIGKSLLNTTTTPKVDAFVKLLIAFRDILIPFLRPVGAACMTGFAAYCTLNDINIDGALHAMLYGTLPAWGVSRHANKQKEIEYSSQSSEDDWDEDDFD